MSHHLKDLAASYGIQPVYTSELGEKVHLTDEAMRGLLEVLRVNVDDAPLGDFDVERPDFNTRAKLPESLAGQRVWGVACQLYAVRSRRNLGFGDFEDLAQLAELFAGLGADFIGVNPLHALFTAAPGRMSPYSPSTRRYLNPLYIAVDMLEGGSDALRELRGEVQPLYAQLDGDLVDYPAVAEIKMSVLRRLFAGGTGQENAAFDAFLESSGDGLLDFALFEAISASEVAAGGHAGWAEWPGDYQSRKSDAVHRFQGEHQEQIRFRAWLQFLADQQLADAQLRAKQAGMRIGLYLDLAVGVAPDGADTWADQELTVRDARIGSPPDALNAEGQDWGLAPLSPRTLDQRSYVPLREAYAAVLKHAGAMRIDHAAGLERLWWVPSSRKPAGGGYVRYSLGAMLQTVTSAANEAQALIIAEDLGTVPEGFSEHIREAGLLSYKPLYFQKDPKSGAFLKPETYPQQALSCISTHDLATLRGWWSGGDIELRWQTGRQNHEGLARETKQRSEDRLALFDALRACGLIQQPDDGSLPTELTLELSVAVHQFVARSPSLLFAVQLDDLLMAEVQANLPGTTDEHPNWRIRTGHTLEDLASQPTLLAICKAIQQERRNSRADVGGVSRSKETNIPERAK